MMSDDFEKAFGYFLERREYDDAEGALFSMVRTAFLAGWRAGAQPGVNRRSRIEFWNWCPDENPWVPSSKRKKWGGASRPKYFLVFSF